MAEFKLSKRVERDLINIAKYTIQNFGEQQSLKYKTELFNCFNRLANNLDLGRSAFEFRAGLKRYNFKAPTVFYEATAYGIFIVRV